MKRLLTALTIVPLLGFAMPVLAAPHIISKRRLPVPVVSPTVLQKYFGQAVWQYRFPMTTTSATGYGEIKNPPLRTEVTQERICDNVTYRMWGVRMNEGLVSKRIGKTVTALNADGFGIIQATQNGRTSSAPWNGTEYQVDCFGNRLRILSVAGEIFTINAADVQRGTLKPPVKLSLEARLNGAVVVEGITQFPGSIDRESYASTAQGDSTIFVLEKDGNVTTHHPTFFKDYNAPAIADLKPTFLNVSGTLANVTATFYRLPDGYGVTEFYGFNPNAYQPLDPICTEGVTCYGNETPDFRIRNGESGYAMVPPFHATKPARNVRIGADVQSGILLLQNMPFNILDLISVDADKTVTKSLIHGAPLVTVPRVPSDQSPGTIALGGSDIRLALDPKGPNRGSIIRETSDRLYARYLVTPYGGTTQYWEAIIEK